MFQLQQKWWGFLQLEAEKKTLFLVQLIQIFDSSYFVKALQILDPITKQPRNDSGKITFKFTECRPDLIGIIISLPSLFLKENCVVHDFSPALLIGISFLSLIIRIKRIKKKLKPEIYNCIFSKEKKYLSNSSTIVWRHKDIRIAWEDTIVTHCNSPLGIRYSKLSSRLLK